MHFNDKSSWEQDLYDFLVLTDDTNIYVTLTLNGKGIMPVSEMMKIKNSNLVKIEVFMNEEDDQSLVYSTEEFTRLFQIQTFYDLDDKVFRTNVTLTVPGLEGLR